MEKSRERLAKVAKVEKSGEKWLGMAICGFMWLKVAKSGFTVQITLIFIDFRVCDFAFAFKTHFIFRQISVLNANETFV